METPWIKCIYDTLRILATKDGREPGNAKLIEMLDEGEAEVARLRALAALAEEIAQVFRSGKGYPLRPFDAAWLARYDSATKEKADG